MDNLWKNLPPLFPCLRSKWKSDAVKGKRYLFSKAHFLFSNSYRTVWASSWNVLHLDGLTETHCHFNSPPVCETCGWSNWVQREGVRFNGSGPTVFEVGIWSSHLHLMPFRLLALTRAKHLTGLGLIWWGHGVTPWPLLPPCFSKWNQLSHRAAGWRWGDEEVMGDGAVAQVQNQPVDGDNRVFSAKTPTTHQLEHL